MATYDTSTVVAGQTIRAIQGGSLLSEVDDGMLLTVQDVAAAITAAVAAAVPSGTLMATARATAPTGYLLCDGTAISRTTYATLFAAIGTVYGTGNGTTTFNLPDLRGRVPVAPDNMGTGAGAAGRLVFPPTPGALGQTGGEATHTLTTGEMPADVPYNAAYGAGVTKQVTAGTGSGNVVPRVDTATGTWQAGGAAAHNTMQPYQIVNWAVKT